MRTLLVVGLACSGMLLADESTDRAKLVGTWQAPENSGPTWILKSAPQGLHVTEMQRNEKTVDFECNTMGRECDIKAPGRTFKILMWYNGPKLVVMQTRGDEVIKYRLQTLDDNKMELEVVPIVPPGKSEVVSLARQTRTDLGNR
jgi:hypothetical protein